VCTTWYGTLLRGVSIEGGDRSVEGGPLEAPTQNGTVREEIEIPIAPEAAHVYTECARIWNPIHTDAAVAKAAGLPALILHGTATLGLAVSRVVERALGGELERVGRIGARFGGMVLMPSVARLQLLDAAGDVAHFQVLNEKGETAIRDGFVALR
jgi:acyl dehydratase